MQKNLSLTVGIAALLAFSAAAESYEDAMKSDAQHPNAVVWQGANAKVITEATDPEVIADFVADAKAADKLLAQLRGAYLTDPVVLTQIAAVTQWVMSEEPCWLWFWQPSPTAGREIWTAALKRKLFHSKDAYIRAFCRQQLDLCE